jgi:hypothetical protein
VVDYQSSVFDWAFLKFVLLLSVSDEFIVSLLLAAGAHYFFLDKKVTKNQDSKKASLPHMTFAQAGGTTGCPQLPPLRSLAGLLATLECPSRRSWPVFCRLLAEADLLSGGALSVRVRGG